MTISRPKGDFYDIIGVSPNELETIKRCLNGEVKRCFGEVESDGMEKRINWSDIKTIAEIMEILFAFS